MIGKKEFTEQVEALLSRSKNVDVLGTIVKVCNDNNLEPETVKRLLSEPLKDKLTAEATRLKLIHRGTSSIGTIDKFLD